MSSTPVLIQTPNRGLAQITNSSGTTAQTLYTGGSNGSKIVGVILTSTDTAAQTVQLGFVYSSTTYILGTVPVPAGAGTNGTAPAVNVLASALLPGLPVDSNGQNYFFLKNASDSITVVPLATITSGKIISAVAVAGDF
jgi:hypothetical protein